MRSLPRRTTSQVVMGERLFEFASTMDSSGPTPGATVAVTNATDRYLGRPSIPS